MKQFQCYFQLITLYFIKLWIAIRNYILEDNYNQLQNAISMSILVSSLQDERYNLAFLTFSYTKGKQIKFSADVIEDFARTDTAIAGLDPWRTEIPLKDFASRVRFQVSDFFEYFYDSKRWLFCYIL